MNCPSVMVSDNLGMVISIAMWLPSLFVSVTVPRRWSGDISLHIQKKHNTEKKPCLMSSREWCNCWIYYGILGENHVELSLTGIGWVI